MIKSMGLAHLLGHQEIYTKVIIDQMKEKEMEK